MSSNTPNTPSTPGGTLTAGKWNETESSEYTGAAKIHDPVLRFLKQLQKENEEDNGD